MISEMEPFYRGIKNKDESIQFWLKKKQNPLVVVNRLLEEGFSAQRAGGLVAGSEPLVLQKDLKNTHHCKKT